MLDRRDAQKESRAPGGSASRGSSMNVLQNCSRLSNDRQEEKLSFGTLAEAIDRVRQLVKAPRNYDPIRHAGYPGGIVVLRFEPPAVERKQVRPLFQGPDGRWYLGWPDGVKPLYHQDRIQKAIEDARRGKLPEIMLVIAEGEKKCDLLQRIADEAGLPWVATCWPCGAVNVLKANWEILRSIPPEVPLRAWLLPDNDTAGRKAMLTLALELKKLGAAEIAITDVGEVAPRLEEGDDIYDLLTREDWGGLEFGESATAHEVLKWLYDEKRDTIENWRERHPEAKPIEPERKPAETERKPNPSADTSQEGEPKRKSKADIAAAIARAHVAEFFYDDDGEAYARIAVRDEANPSRDHIETWPLRSRTFRNWLCGMFYVKTNGKGLSETCFRTALAALEGYTLAKGRCRRVFTRVAPADDGGIWLDLGDELWRAVYIGPAGWRVVESPFVPVRFVRTPSMRPLPVPVKTDRTLDDLRSFLNVKTDEDWALVKAWLRATLMPEGPYPILCLTGAPGSGKTMAAMILKMMTDPTKPMLRSPPRNTEDMLIAGRGSWIVAYNNVSTISRELSDELCRLSEGSGITKRQLYTNFDEASAELARPIILTGIGQFAKEPDLLDRAIIIELDRIPDDGRETVKRIRERFLVIWPELLGALLSDVAAGFRELPNVQITRPPRLDDFAHFAVACERGAGEPEAFLNAFQSNYATADSTALEANPAAQVLLRVFDSQDPIGRWKCTASELLQLLEENATERERRSLAWPKSPRSLSNELRRLTPQLERAGLRIHWGRAGKERKRIIEITRIISLAAAPAADTTAFPEYADEPESEGE